MNVASLKAEIVAGRGFHSGLAPEGETHTQDDSGHHQQKTLATVEGPLGSVIGR
jgi:hypothetical protein